MHQHVIAEADNSVFSALHRVAIISARAPIVRFCGSEVEEKNFGARSPTANDVVRSLLASKVFDKIARDCDFEHPTALNILLEARTRQR